MATEDIYPVHERELPANAQLRAPCSPLPRRPDVRDDRSRCMARARCSEQAGGRVLLCCHAVSLKLCRHALHGNMTEQHRMQPSIKPHRMTWLRLREMSTSDRLFSAMLVACATATELAVSALGLIRSAPVGAT